MRQINPNGFQSLCCSMYVYDFVAIKLFDFEDKENKTRRWNAEKPLDS